MFTLSEILEATGGKFIYGREDIAVSNISSDSRSLNTKDLFIAIRGKNFDGHNFILDAINKGASVVVVDGSFRLDASGGKLRHRDHEKVAYVRVADTLKALGDIASFHRARFNIPVIAVSG